MMSNTKKIDKIPQGVGINTSISPEIFTENIDQTTAAFLQDIKASEINISEPNPEF